MLSILLIKQHGLIHSLISSVYDCVVVVVAPLLVLDVQGNVLIKVEEANLLRNIGLDRVECILKCLFIVSNDNA